MTYKIIILSFISLLIIRKLISMYKSYRNKDYAEKRRSLRYDILVFLIMVGLAVALILLLYRNQ